MNSVLAGYKENNVKTIEDCEKIAINPSKIDTNNTNTQIISDKHIYSKEELDNLFNEENKGALDF